MRTSRHDWNALAWRTVWDRLFTDGAPSTSWASKKTTAWGESGFPSEFLGLLPSVRQERAPTAPPVCRPMERGGDGRIDASGTARYHNQPKSHPGTNDPTAPLRNLCCSKPAPCRGAPGIPPELRSTRLRRCCATGPAGRPNPPWRTSSSPTLRQRNACPISRLRARSNGCRSVSLRLMPSQPPFWCRQVARGLAPNSGVAVVGPPTGTAMGPGGMRPSFRGWPAQGDHLVLVHVWLVRHLSHRVPSQVDPPQVDPPQGGTVRSLRRPSPGQVAIRLPQWGPFTFQVRTARAVPCIDDFSVARDADAGGHGLSARTGDGYLQPVGQRPAVPGADRALRSAVRGYGQHDGHVAVGVRFDDDLPTDVAGRV